MKILAFDTTSVVSSVALAVDGNVVAERTLTNRLTNAERLLPSVEELLAEAGVEVAALDGFGVAIGPGSFTGLRIGLAAAKMMSFTLAKPIVGVSSLLALAYHHEAQNFPVVSLIDARRNQLYIGAYGFGGKAPKIFLKDTVMSPVAALDYIASLKSSVAFAGDGVDILKERIIELIGGKSIISDDPKLRSAACHVALQAGARISAGSADDVRALNPNYIRKSDAEIMIV